MKFKSLEDFDRVYLHRMEKQLYGIKDYKIYSLKYPQREAKELKYRKFSNKLREDIVSDGKYLFYISNYNLYCTTYEDYGFYYEVEPLELVKYSDTFYDTKIYDFLKLPFCGDVIKYIIQNRENVSIVFDLGDTKVQYIDNEYKIIHYKSFYGGVINCEM